MVQGQIRFGANGGNETRSLTLVVILEYRSKDRLDKACDRGAVRGDSDAIVDNPVQSISRKSRRIMLSTIALLLLITVCQLVGVPNVEPPLTFYVDLANLGLLPLICGPYRHD
jgi:hypothetical protein